MFNRKLLLSMIALLVVALLFTSVASPRNFSKVKAQDPVTITWFVGLGAGGQPEQIDAQNAVVAEFNETHDDIQIEILIVDNDVAFDTLSTLIAAGDAPDVVGPVGIRGSNAYSGQWLDLQPVLDSSGFDLGIWEQALVDFYRVEGEGLIGLPFGVFPSALYYNRDLFDEAGLDYPPAAYGEPYADGDEWTVEKLTEIARLLTLDANGNTSGSDGFDANNIVQFGYNAQWAAEARAAATTPFGAGSFVGEDGVSAVVPENWAEGLAWYYEGMWGDAPYIPNDPYEASETFGAGNAFSSGNVAMAATHLWYTCCLGEVDNWDLAALPSYNGEVSAKLHADTFRILGATEHPAEALEVLTYLVTEAAPTLLQVYGGLPAIPDQQEAFFAGLDETYPQGVNWQAAIDSLDYPDNPSHEGNMPNFNQADERISAFWTRLRGTDNLDIAAELETLRSELEAIFGAAPAQ